MSRKGNSPITVPSGVTWEHNDNKLVVKGSKGSLELNLPGEYELNLVESRLSVKPLNEASSGAKHGLTRALVNNLIIGVSDGFKKDLELIGVGFRAAVVGNQVDLQLGFSHPTKMDIPLGIKVEVEKNTLIKISGMDKQAVGQFAAEIRALKKPEPYKGKGIRYSGEYVRRKAGKTSKK